MPWRISESDIDRIKRSTDLIALVQSRGIELKKHGSKDWIGRCPFHSDNLTPNLIVSPHKGLWHCMACGKAGNPILQAYQVWLWRYTRPNGRRLGWKTQRDKLGTLKDWFRWMTRQNVILSNPASELDLPRAEKRLPTQALSPSEMDKLLSVPDVSDPLGVRDRTMLEVFYTTGMRRAELCNLELSDLNTERRTLTVRQGKGKKDRVVPVGGRAVQWLERYLNEVRPRLCQDTRTQALFLTGYGEAFNPDVLSRRVSAWIKKVTGRTASCHLLRHTCATHMLDGGADIRYIQQLLGHEKLDTTAIYTEVSIKRLQEVHARCHPAGPAISGEAEANPASVPPGCGLP